MERSELASKIADAFTPKVSYTRMLGWRPYADTFELFEDKDYCTRFLREWKSLNKKYKQRFYTDKTSRDMTLILIEQALDVTEHVEE